MQAGQPVAQALYAGTRPMPWQQSTGGGAAFDSSFGCALDLDGLAWARSSGGAKVNAKRFGAGTPSGSDRRNYNVDQLSLAKGVEHSQRVYSCFSSTSSRFGASLSNTADGPGPGAYFSDVSRQAMVVQNQAPIVSALGRTPLGVSRIVGPGFPGAALPPGPLSEFTPLGDEPEVTTAVASLPQLEKSVMREPESKAARAALGAALRDARRVDRRR